ncbi:hypothetical protein [Mesorhizobium sp. B263B2A]|uniref:hypothetical protein n=1 Tax=Mesorhizobium sp. B263B2A TaxID=2876669 RepID=UPI001CD0AC55|nr:hypothetical protein [Mesorhizobium sp. B263B2A]MCA0032722.1 hypothetical protein [Mesorhizobium sp. B263B2A]
MSEPSRYGSVPKQGDQMSTSVAAKEAFELLNAATQKEWRGWGDTRTAARDRAAKKAGLTPAQAERLWKNWQTLKFPNGDVYRLLRNKYGHLCAWVENAADAMERERREIEGKNATDQSHPSVGGRVAGASRSPSEQEMR